MPLEVKIPAAGESVSRVLVGRWHKREGDMVKRDERLVDIETDKATAEVLAPAAGRLTKIMLPDGAEAKVGDVVALLEEGVGAATPVAPPPNAPTSDATPPPSGGFVMPAAARLAAERGLDPRGIPGTGPGGRVLKEDVVVAPANSVARPPGASPAAPLPMIPPKSFPAFATEFIADRQEKVIPMTPLREKIARNLVQAKQDAALVTTFNEIDMSAVMDLRKEMQEQFLKKHGVKLGFMSFFVKACVDALRQYPMVNAEVRGRDVAYRNYFDVGVAVGGGKGLVVPVLRNAERLSFAELEKRISDFAARSKENKLALDEIVGGTFTISNGGVFGSLLSTPIVNPPQSGILGLHAIQDRPVARNGQVVIRPMMYVALTYDHRVVDGRESVGFLVRIKECLENPTRMLVEA